jgi:hypothetical protein
MDPAAASRTLLVNASGRERLSPTTQSVVLTLTHRKQIEAN